MRVSNYGVFILVETLSDNVVSNENKRDRRLLRLKLPEHVAIIMDGNGRWAQQQGKTRVLAIRMVLSQYEQALVSSELVKWVLKR